MEVKNKNSYKKKEKSNRSIIKKIKIKLSKKSSSKNKNKKKFKAKKSSNKLSSDKNIINKVFTMERNNISIINKTKTINKDINNKKNKILNIIPKKVFIDSKVGTPHFDMIKYLKFLITEKDKKINQLTYLKGTYTNELKNIIQKLEDILINFKESPEQKNKIKLLYLILNINMKNNDDTINRNKSLKKEYKLLLNKDNYNPNERIDEFRTKIDISKNENLDIINQIKELKNNNCIKRNKLKSFAFNKRHVLDINNLTNELNTLNNEKHEALLKLKNNKKVIKSCIIKFKNLMKTYEDFKNENKNIYKNNINKVEKDINILKKDLSGDEEQIFNKIQNNQILIFKEYSFSPQRKKTNSQILEKLSKNNSFIKEQLSLIPKEKIIIKRNESDELLKRYKNKSYFGNKNIIINLKKKIVNLKPLPKINQKNYFNNLNISSFINNSNSSKYIFNYDNEKSYFDELNISSINDINYLKLYNNKKDNYTRISKKLDYSIKEAENMYKRKISQIEEEFNENLKKFSNIEKRNNLLKNEIKNLYENIHLQKDNSNNQQIKNNKNDFSYKLEDEKIINTNITFINNKINNSMNNEEDLKRTNIINEIKKKYKEEIPFLSSKNNQNKLFETELEL